MSLRLHNILVLLILGITLVLGLSLAWKVSATTDEGIHVSSAYLALTRQEFRFDPEHPYLFKYATAVPFLFLKTNLPANDATLWGDAKPTVYDSWQEARQWSDEWFFNSGNNGHLMIFLSRIPGVLVMLLLTALTYFLAKKWFSPRVGLLALVFTAFSPTILAHGHLTNTDVPSAFGYLLALAGLYKYYEFPTKKNALLSGFFFAIALTIKFSTILLAPVAFFWLLYVGYKKNIWRKLPLHALLFIGITLLWIWTVYQFPFRLFDGTLFTVHGSTTLPSYIPLSQSLFNNLLLLRFILPLDYLKGLSLVFVGSYLGRPVYFMGESHLGIWTYFPLLFLLKTQLIGILLLIVGIAPYITKPILLLKKWTPATTLIVLSIVIFLFSALTSKLNLGIRHILPILPLVYIAMAASLNTILPKNTSKYTISSFVIGLYILPLILSYPHYIEYTNIVVQPPEKTHTYFNDSNLDWGQQAGDIARLVKQEYPNKKIYINYFWNPYILPYYGLESSQFDPHNPPVDGIIILTATQLTFPEYGYFRDLKPVNHISTNTYFYSLPQ